MRIPSRRMPKYTAPTLGWFGKVALVVLMAVLVYVIADASWTKLLVVAIALTVLVFFGMRSLKVEQERLQTLAANRFGESICEFARSFDCRQVDTWVIRAVYEELQEALPWGTKGFPVRASDDLNRDLLDNDIEAIEDLIPILAARTGRSLTDTESNPYWNKIRTAADLVYFINAQPHVATSR